MSSQCCALCPLASAAANRFRPLTHSFEESAGSFRFTSLRSLSARHCCCWLCRVQLVHSACSSFFIIYFFWFIFSLFCASKHKRGGRKRRLEESLKHALSETEKLARWLRREESFAGRNQACDKFSTVADSKMCVYAKLDRVKLNWIDGWNYYHNYKCVCVFVWLLLFHKFKLYMLWFLVLNRFFFYMHYERERLRRR